MNFTWSAEKYAPIGHCIYCGKSEGETTNEHIVPKGLQPKGGDWFLPAASCKDCADITKKFEGACLQGMLGPLRYKLNLKSTEKRKEVPATYNYRVDGSLENKEITLESFPATCFGFDWPAPGLLTGEVPKSAFEDKLIVKVDTKKLEEHASDSKAFKLGRIFTNDFGRMIAKIAHCYAVAKYGEKSFKPLTRDFILGKESIGPYLVGGDKSGFPLIDQPNVLHDVYRQDCCTNGIEYFLVAVRLFAFIGMPRYMVVVGEKV